MTEKTISLYCPFKGQGRKQQDPDPLVRAPDPDLCHNVTDPQH